MARESYDQQLVALQQEILKMGSFVEDAIHSSVQCLAEQDLELAAKVINDDDFTDHMENEIEEGCLRLIALQQPLARDLRTVATILKTVGDLERMGDLAVNIAEVAERIGTEPLIKPLIDIPRMARMTEDMVRGALDSFVRRDVVLAQQVRDSDDQVDDLYSELFDELIGFVLEGGDVKRASQAINLLFVARYLERIADHATNIAENVIYMITGKRVAHEN